MVGPGMTLKVPTEVAVPTELVTWICPVLPAPGTLARIWVSLTMVKPAAIAPKRTALVPVKLVPKMSTWMNWPPEVGEKLVIVGAPALVTVKMAGEAALVRAV